MGGGWGWGGVGEEGCGVGGWAGGQGWSQHPEQAFPQPLTIVLFLKEARISPILVHLWLKSSTPSSKIHSVPSDSLPCFFNLRQVVSPVRAAVYLLTENDSHGCSLKRSLGTHERQSSASGPGVQLDVNLSVARCNLTAERAPSLQRRVMPASPAPGRLRITCLRHRNLFADFVYVNLCSRACSYVYLLWAEPTEARWGSRVLWN